MTESTRETTSNQFGTFGGVFTPSILTNELLHETSGTSDLVILGFKPPSDADAEQMHALYSQFVEDMPTALLVSSAGHANLTS